MEPWAILVCLGLFLFVLLACLSFASAYGKLLVKHADLKDETKLLMDDASRYCDSYLTTAAICRGLIKMTPLRFCTPGRQREILAMLAQGAEIEY